jgi:hypothetical protein
MSEDKVFKSSAEQLYDFIDYNNLFYYVAQIEYIHERIHKGNVFYNNYKRTYSTNNTVDFILKTFDKEIHLGYVMVGTSYSLNMYEISPASSTTEMSFINRNYNVANIESGSTNDICRCYRFLDANINTYTLLSEDLINLEVSSASSNKFSVELSSKEERILKKNSTYLFRITSKANTNIICDRLDFYYK